MQQAHSGPCEVASLARHNSGKRGSIRISLVSSLPYLPNIDTLRGTQIRYSDLQGLISPDPNSEADKSLVYVQSHNHSPIALGYSTQKEVIQKYGLWWDQPNSGTQRPNIACTNPWGFRKLVLCSYAPSAGFILGAKCQVSQFLAISAVIRMYFYQKFIH